MLAKEGGALGKMMPVFNIFAGGPLGSGRQWCSWIHRCSGGPLSTQSYHRCLVALILSHDMHVWLLSFTSDEKPRISTDTATHVIISHV